jgi:hypothetical protein
MDDAQLNSVYGWNHKVEKADLNLKIFEGVEERSGDSQARSKAQASGACPIGVRGFKSRSPHQYL